jgi:transmembrane sensor
MTFEEQDDIAEQARAWVVRLASGEMAESERAALLAWLAESETHARAFEAERAFWRRLAPLQETFERLDRTERSAAAPSPPRRIRRPHIAITGTLALAACLLLLLFAPQLALFLKADHVSGGDKVLAVTLPDGSRVTLDRNSAIRVAYDNGQRQVELLQGEAFVEVMPETARPFRLLAAGGVSEALGTAYAVRLEDAGARVAVTEGHVAVSSAAPPAETRELTAGQALRYDAGGRLAASYAFDRSHALAWRQGRVVLVDLPLGEALAELDRYQPGRILLLGGGRPAAAVSGVIDLEHLDEGLAALAATHGLTVHHLTPFLTVLR